MHLFSIFRLKLLNLCVDCIQSQNFVQWRWHQYHRIDTSVDFPIETITFYVFVSPFNRNQLMELMVPTLISFEYWLRKQQLSLSHINSRVYFSWAVLQSVDWPKITLWCWRLSDTACNFGHFHWPISVRWWLNFIHSQIHHWYKWAC